MLRTDHIVFPVWNAKASLDFYAKVMGFALTATVTGPDWGGFPWLMMMFSPGDGREIVLVALKGAKRPKSDGLARDVRHLAFAEKSKAALSGWRKKLKSACVEFWEEDHGSQQSLYFEDPNGMVLEITAPPSRAGKATRAQALRVARCWIEDVA